MGGARCYKYAVVEGLGGWEVYKFLTTTTTTKNKEKESAIKATEVIQYPSPITFFFFVYHIQLFFSHFFLSRLFLSMRERSMYHEAEEATKTSTINREDLSAASLLTKR